MKNQEILRRRAELNSQYDKIQREWKSYDEQYPVLPGAYKPSDYDSQQARFLERLSEVSNEIAALPRTTGEKLRLALIWTALFGVVVLLVWWLLL
jgi:hypothetical protein